jgi:hypothetical protein
MKYPRLAMALTLILLVQTFVVQAGWKDWMKTASEFLGKNPQAVSALDQTEIVAGLRAALSQGTRLAILSLGRTDGYLANPLAHIPLPAPMDSLEPKLRRFGLGMPLDAFEKSINRAAEQAVPEVADIFSKAIDALTIEDALGILNGPDDSATRYFQNKTNDALVARIQPLVTQATVKAGVTQNYKALTAQAGPMAAMLLGPDLQDLDGYVTNKALGGLFSTIALEEKKIRDNPSARTTEILKKVFGQRAS